MFSEKTFPEAYQSLPPDAVRKAAWRRFEQGGGLPSRHDEAWRWSDLKAALTSLTPSFLAKGDNKSVLHGLLDLPDMTAATDAHEICFEDGLPVSGLDGLPEGLELVRTGMDKTDRTMLSFPPDLSMTLPLALALASQPVILRVRAGVKLARPVHLRWASQGAAVHTVLQVIVERDAQLTLLETLEAGLGYANGAGLFILEEKAQLERMLVQGGGIDAVMTRSDTGRLARGACWRQNALTFGAKLARLETRLSLEGEQTDVHLHGAYLLDGARHADFTSRIDHKAKACQTRQQVKGVATDKARGVFQGLFHVAREADKTEARMNHQALLLSEKARASAKPELEIYADDVQCSHGCATGALDEAALFYMRQRGLPEQTARAMLTEAFLLDVFEQTGPQSVRAAWRAAAQNWLGFAAFKEAA